MKLFQRSAAKFFPKTLLPWISGGICFLATSLQALEIPRIESRFDPVTLSPGERGQLIIDVIGGGKVSDNPSIQVENLELRRMHGSHAVRLVNGESQSVTTFTYLLRPERIGTFYLNGGFITVDGKPQAIPTAVLNVRHREMLNSATETLRKNMRLEVNYDNRHLFRDQAFPIEIILWVRDGLRFRLGEKVPQMVGSGFELAYLEPQSAGNESSASEGMKKISWKGILRVRDAGAQELFFVLGLHVELPNRGENAINRENLDGAFQDLFADQLIWQEAFVRSPREILSILLVPQQNQPPNYSKAIGQFEMDGNRVILPEKPDVGAPIEVQFYVKGKGNFSQIQTPEQHWGKEWNSYRHEKSFEGLDSLGDEGIETFRFWLVPQSRGILKIPPFEFNYFDPESGNYRRLNSSVELPIYVGVQNVAAAENAWNASAKISEIEESSWQFPPLRPNIGTLPRLSLSTPLYGSAWFWGIQGIVFYILLFYAVWQGKRFQRRAPMEDHFAGILDGESRKLLRNATDAIEDNQPSRCYECIRLAISATIVRLSHQNPHMLTQNEVERVIGKMAPQNVQLLHEAIYFFEIPPADRSESAKKISARKLHGDLQRAIGVITNLQGL